MNVRTQLMKTGLTALSVTGTHKLLEPMAQGLGLIFTLHRVRPQQELDSETAAHPTFQPNALLEITPEFLDAVLASTKARGMALLCLDEALEAICNPAIRTGRFAALTFDDGYIDNRDYALPVLEAHNAPASVYIPSAFPQGEGELWWVALEEMIRSAERLSHPGKPGAAPLPLQTAEQKSAAFNELYWELRGYEQDHQRAVIAQMADEHGYDMRALCQRLVMDTAALKTFAQHPLISIGAHTITHRAIARLSPQCAAREMSLGADWLEETLGERPTHFAFPYGDRLSAGERDFALAREAGFKSAVTTRKGMLYPEHKDHLFALPRVSLNGDYQEQRFLNLFMTGAPFLLANKFKKVA